MTEICEVVIRRRPDASSPIVTKCYATWTATTRVSTAATCQVRLNIRSQSQQGRCQAWIVNLTRSVCDSDWYCLILSLLCLVTITGTHMQRVGTLKSQHNLRLDCYNKYIRDKRRFQT